jgi:hypothetical protein
MKTKTIEEKTRNILTEEQLKKLNKESPVDFIRLNTPGEPCAIFEKRTQIGVIDNYNDADDIARMLSAKRLGLDSTMAEDIIFRVSTVFAHNWEINLYLNIILYQIMGPPKSKQELKERFLKAFDEVVDNALAASASGKGFQDVPFEDTQRII